MIKPIDFIIFWVVGLVLSAAMIGVYASIAYAIFKILT